LNSRFKLRVQAIFAAANLYVENSPSIYKGDQRSIGIGVGTSYALINKRFSANVYVNAQGELGFNQFRADGKSEWFATNNGGGNTTQNLPPSVTGIPQPYRQFSLAGEAGLCFNYILNRPRWSVNASAGYRNYFWQQKVESEGGVRMPSLLNLNAGIRFTL
jgi:hypothetical protein